MKRLAVLTGGGTLGHVTPNLSVAAQLQKLGWDVHYIGSHSGPEVEAARGAGLPYSGIPSGKLRRYFDLKNFIDPLYVLGGMFRAWQILGQLRPNIVFSKGGFVTFPVVFAAWLRGIPTVIHESDLTPGLANRLAFPFAGTICTGFPETVQLLGGRKAVYTGTPCRPDLGERDRDRAQKRWGLDPGKTTVLAFGGSLGSRAINQAIRAVVAMRQPELQFLHICGRKNVDHTLDGTPGYLQFEILNHEFPDALAAADVAVSRAGATSITELIEAKVPAILIPLPLSQSRGDQIENSKSFTSRGLGITLDEASLTPDSLLAAIRATVAQTGIFRQKMAETGPLHCASSVVKVLIDKARP